MERNANYALVGLIATLLTIGLFVFIVWLAGGAWRKTFDYYDIVFVGPVHGLTKGGEVDFNGIKVGDVTKVALDPKDSRLVIARAKVTTDVPIRADSYAQLEPQGITGVNYVQISAGSEKKPLLKDTVPEGTVPRLGSKRDALSDLLANGGLILASAQESLQRLNRVLSDQNIKSLTATLSNVQAVTEELRERKAIIADAQTALQNASAAAVQLRELAKSSQGVVEGPGKHTITKFGDTATQLEASIKELRALMAKIDQPTTEFARQGLPQLTETLTSLQRTSDDLDKILDELRSSPRGLLIKPSAKQVEVKP